MSATPEQRVLAGILAILAGAGIALLVYLHPAGLNVPAPVVYLAALAFVFAGGLLLAQAGRHRRLQAWLPVALLACMVAPAIWLAFGGQRCVAGSAFGALQVFGLGSELACRAGFGVASVVGLGMVAIAIRRAVQSPGTPD